MDEQTVAQRTRDEAIVQLVGAVVLIAGYVVLTVIERKAADPDFTRVWKMRAAKAAERFCAASAVEWWRLAERARLAYEAERP